MTNRFFRLIAALALLGAAAAASAKPDEQDNAALRQQVIATERAFAATMANRDFEAFKTFIAEEAVFDGLRGKEAVVAAWKQFFDGPDAPFSWAPDRVVVLNSGTLAQSGGPVRDPGGQITARFSSIWRQESPGRWRIIFDKGEAHCNCKQPAVTDPEQELK